MKLQIKQTVTAYLAASYLRAWEMRGFREVLQDEFGWTVTSGWIDKTEPNPICKDDLADVSVTAPPEMIAASAETYRRAQACALENMDDLFRASTVIIFTRQPSTSGGYHTELGMALASQKRIILIGPRENVFQALPAIQRFDNFQDFTEWLKGL